MGVSGWLSPLLILVFDGKQRRDNSIDFPSIQIPLQGIVVVQLHEIVESVSQTSIKRWTFGQVNLNNKETLTCSSCSVRVAIHFRRLLAKLKAQ